MLVRVVDCVCNSPRGQDLVSTGALGYEFIKLDAGMTELLRPSLYGALHPIVVVPSKVRSSHVMEARIVFCSWRDLFEGGAGGRMRFPFTNGAWLARLPVRALFGDGVVPKADSSCRCTSLSKFWGVFLWRGYCYAVVIVEVCYHGGCFCFAFMIVDRSVMSFLLNLP